MVAGKVKAAMGFQRSPATTKTEKPQRSSSSPASQRAAAAGGQSLLSANAKAAPGAFARSFGAHFPRSSAQVQPRLPEVAELLRLVEELQEKESRLRTQLLEQKLLKETVAIVPFLEQEIASKTDALLNSQDRIQRLEAENQVLQDKVVTLNAKFLSVEEESHKKDKRIKELEKELERQKKAAVVVVSDNSTDDSGRQLCGGGTGEIEDCSSSQMFQGLINASAKSNLLKNLKGGPKSTDIASNQEVQKRETTDPKEEEADAEGAHLKVEGFRHRAPRIPKPPPLPSTSSPFSTSSTTSSSLSSETSYGATRSHAPNLAGLPPIPLPLPSGPVPGPTPASGARPTPPPPPPPPPAKGAKPAAGRVRRVPEVVEFYHSLMRRDSKKESSAVGVPDAPVVSALKARNMIGEIENRSAHLLAIKTDVETQGDFIRFLIKKVENAAFTNIEDVVAFVKWLDDELSFLVDERAVLKHFEWPEHKADAMREAAFGYCDLKKLESEASSFCVNRRQPCVSALKKMQALFEKLEQVVDNLSRVREGAMKKYKGFRIPWDWMLETGYISQIKLASVKLAMKYMKRISSELEDIASSSDEEELMLHGVRFAFRVHQFAGGFDVETMRAFQEFKNKARTLHLQSHIQHQ